MADKESQNPNVRQPLGFTTHSSGLASEYAREQGWGINEDERTRPAKGKQDIDGGTDYDYGPQDFGDTAVDTSAAQPPAQRAKGKPGRQKKPSKSLAPRKQGSAADRLAIQIPPGNPLQRYRVSTRLNQKTGGTKWLQN